MSSIPVLAGATAVVTGGNRGIGAAIAEALAADGANLVVTGRDAPALTRVAEKLQNDHGVTVRAQVCDVTDADAVAELERTVAAGTGTLDILVNNAGAAASAPFARMEDAVWQRMIETNLTGVYRVTQALLPHMTGASGRIINIASTAGLIGMAYVTAYCAAKHGVVGLTRALAKELAPRGITVNAVCPGYTETELVDGAVSNISGKTGMNEADARASLISDVPIGRFIRPEEVADTVRWLSGPGAAGVTGAAIPVAGGAV